ncbi:flagellar filament capping protein FliD [Pseudomonas sp. R5(2019)]|uniref:flagellar filament capping protein FliD n=1 Tax=Pseudomonas sp. R5(2019) TaxID=2697566 RepID=UPI001412E20A|nr:flagellar filament capping protein FliD [Pseudomonas sp. R5(2019)]NBA95759.1 flagellar filament capping protein FliD [Pseudomonas sp. R5(2019)]
MAGTTVSGIGSGIDTQSIVTALVNSEKAPKQAQIDAQTKTATTSLSAIGTIKSALDAYRTAIDKLNTTTNFSGLTGASSDKDVAKVTVGDAASSGNYSLEITQLATASKIASQVYAGGAKSVVNDTGSSTTLTIGQGDATYSATIAAGATLEEARESINSQLQGKGISANVLTDASGSRLVFTSTKMGAGTELTLGGGSELASDFTIVATPQNAKYKLDSMELEANSNTVTEAVSGLTIELTKEGKSTLSVATSTDTLKTSVQSFVTAYNTLMTAINAQTKVTAGTGGSDAPTAAALTGDATMRALVSTIRSELTSPNGAGALQTLSQLGINTVQKTGLLELNSTKWDKAVKTYGTDIAGMFTGKNGLLTRMSSITENYTKTNGILATRQTNITNQLSDITKAQEALDRRIETMTTTLSAKYNAMDTLVAQLNATSSSIMTTLNALNKVDSDS